MQHICTYEMMARIKTAEKSECYVAIVRTATTIDYNMRHNIRSNCREMFTKRRIIYILLLSHGILLHAYGSRADLASTVCNRINRLILVGRMEER